MKSIGKISGRILSAGLAVAALGAWNCTISDSGSGVTGGGISLSITDTTQIVVQFTNTTDTHFSDSATFDLADIRKKIDDKGISLSSISIPNLTVAYDSD